MKRTVTAFLVASASEATTFAPGVSLTPLASSWSPAAVSSASDFRVPLSKISFPVKPVGAIGLP